MELYKLRYLLVIVLHLSGFLQAQEFHFGIVNDTDGYVNCRTEPNKFSTINTTLKTNTVVYYFLETTPSNWININYFQNGKENSGYVYYDRIQSIEGFSALKSSILSKDEMLFKNDNYEILVTLQGFDKKQHKFSYNKLYPSTIDKIDGESYYGTDGNMPANEFKSIKIKSRNKVFYLPEHFLKKLYEINFNFLQVFENEKNNTIYIYGLGGDGAGGYAMLFTITDFQNFDRFITIPF
ncbi:hypothetical protein [Flavobacterium croceum]|uniref:SH3 domain-containing protein n=1 Tax=Flavobacterium croceum DSM 17960 TaxID=1121886 RepID=A0A2S4N6C0_9FLAO|nr:hypothetical protein [Flavobacterium croceum]POS00853.1 hypothetical protein Q361_11911 [Flavobacterium croceum DSM 17960]